MHGPALKYYCTDYFLDLRKCWEGGEEVLFCAVGVA